jgi:acyl carrier protein
MPTAKKWERSDIERIIRQMIVSLLNLTDMVPEDISLSQPNFFTEMGATSIDTLELFLAVEQNFGFQFDETELNPGLLNTLDGFVDLVFTKIQGNF